MLVSYSFYLHELTFFDDISAALVHNPYMFSEVRHL